MTAWLAERVAPSGRVLAIDIETNWLEPLRSEIIEVRQADISVTALPRSSFDLVLARMLLLHLPDPDGVCCRLVAACVPGGRVVMQDADFTPVAMQDATAAEAAGLAVMTTTMHAAGVHLALGPELSSLLEAAGARVENVEVSHSPGRGGQAAALITAITLERFRERAVRAGASDETLDAAIAALQDPERISTGPTQWIVTASVSL